MAVLTLRAEGITKSYGADRKPAVNNVSFSVLPGEIIGILGPTGAGKTSLLKLIGGLSMPDSGDIKVMGTSMYRDYEKCMLDIGFVPDRPEMYPYMTGIENLRTFAAMYPNVPTKTIGDLIARLRLEEYVDRRLSECPVGIRQRLAIAAALLNSPRLLVIDEAMDGLDPVAIVDLARMLRSLARKFNMSTIISSHQINDLERMCDRIGIMSGGRMEEPHFVEDLKKSNVAKLKHRIRLDRPDEAAGFINEVLGYGVKVEEDCIVVETEQGNIPRMISMLFERRINVYEIVPVERTLEYAYFAHVKHSYDYTGGRYGGDGDE